MIIVMNPLAAGGSSVRKWNQIEHIVHSITTSPGIFLLNGRASTERFIRNSLRMGETRFVAAGGDGTVNALLNELLSAATPEQRMRLQIGAIGLGSSNDFHKPFGPAGMIGTIPGKVNFHDTACRDVGCVSFEKNGGFVTRYFLVNASIGVTAEANLFFNTPGRFLRMLKRAHTPAAILFAALKTIVSYRNIRITLRRPGFPERDLSLTNLALLKSPHVSGSLCYNAAIPPDDGLLRAYLCTRMTKLELLRLLWTLSGGSLQPGGASRAGGPGGDDPARGAAGFTSTPGTVPKIESFELPSILVTSSEPFAVEYDGEVVTTSVAQFSVLPRHLQVCRS